VRDTGSGSRSQVEHLGSGHDVNLVDAAKNGRGQLGPERVPDSVLGLGGSGSCSCSIFSRSVGVCPRNVLVVDRDPFLAVDGLSGTVIECDESVLLTASDEYSGVSVRLDDDGLAAATSTSTSAPSTAGSSATSRCSSAAESTPISEAASATAETSSTSAIATATSAPETATSWSET
jgi:hypothetical protein